MSGNTPTQVELDLKEQEQYDRDFNALQKDGELPSADDGETSSVEVPADPPDDEILESTGEGSPQDEGKGDDEPPTSEADDPYAWINELPEEVKARAEQLRHSSVSNSGRVAALRRRVSEFESREAARAQSSSRQQPTGTTTTPTDPPETSEELKEFMEKYPALANSVQELVNQERSQMQRELDERVGPVQEELRFQKSIEAKERLETGAAEIFSTAETGIHYTDVTSSTLYNEEFLGSQPEEFRRIATTTADPDTALWVLKQFATFAEEYAEKHGLLDEEGSNAEGNSTTTSAADKARATRARRKAEGTTPPSRSAVSDPEDLSDYDALFKSHNSGKG
jgi:hypothetical protein